MAEDMTVRLVGQITGSRNGQAWPPAGTEVTLPSAEAISLVESGMARPVDSRALTVEMRQEAAAAAVDPITQAQVDAATVTRARAATSKRAHEPVHFGAADEEQPDEADNGPQLPEVNAQEAAQVEDPTVDTSSTDGPTGAMKAPSGTESPSDGGASEAFAQDDPGTSGGDARKAKGGAAKSGGADTSDTAKAAGKS